MSIKPRKWSQIFSRPAHLEFEHWDVLRVDVDSRRVRLAADAAKLSEPSLAQAHAFELAATDLFVEKAQTHLTLRAHKYTWSGLFLAAVALIIVAIALWIVSNVTFPRSPGWPEVVLFVLKSAGIAGFAGAGLYFTASLSRAFFHEATTLYNRRHALRFGRMFVYLRFGMTKDERERLLGIVRDASLREIGDDKEHTMPVDQLSALLGQAFRSVTAEELERAFGWNLETYTGFRDLKPEQMSTNIYAKTVDVMGKLIESLAKVKQGEGGPGGAKS